LGAELTHWKAAFNLFQRGGKVNVKKKSKRTEFSTSLSPPQFSNGKKTNGNSQSAKELWSDSSPEKEVLAWLHTDYTTL
jgi:hypothetical protein